MKIKKTLSLLLSVVMIFSITIPAFAENTQEEANTPFILVAGMDVLPLYKADSNYTEKVWPMASDKIMPLVGKLIFPAISLIMNKDYNKFGDKLFPLLSDAFADMKCDENGNGDVLVSEKFLEPMSSYPNLYKDETKDELGIVKAACDRFGAENVYFFNYDWRLDPLSHADDLNTLIEKAKADSGSDKVMLACCSMGGVITMSYIEKYGSQSLKSVTLLSTAFYGVSDVGHMLSGDLYVDKDALIRRVVNLGKTPAKTMLFKSLMTALDKIGIADRIVNFANDLISNLHDRIYDELLTPVFGSMPGIWALLNRDDYVAAKAYMLSDSENAQLIAKTEYYLNYVQANAEALLKAANANGTIVNIVCQYNMQSLPVTSDSDENNDLLIDVTYASGGAVAADLDKNLPEGYVQAIDDGHNHISSDNVIDASTCIFPDNTWFIKDQAHVDYNVGMSTDFIFDIASASTQTTVFSNASYPQFMKYNAAKNTLEAVK